MREVKAKGSHRVITTRTLSVRKGFLETDITSAPKGVNRNQRQSRGRAFLAGRQA